VSATTIDHLVLPVSGLAVARDRLTALGFTVAPDAEHPFGTANACVFLEDGAYLEPLALRDRRRAGAAAKRGNVFTGRDLAFRGKKGRQGLSAIAVATSDAEGDDRRYRDAGLSGGEILEFGRIVRSPAGDEIEARFRLAFIGDGSDLFAFAVQRLVSFPQDLGDLRFHANTVTGLKEIVLSGVEGQDMYPLMQLALRSDGEVSDTGRVFKAANARVRVAGAEQLALEFGLSAVSHPAGMLSAQAVIFRTADLAVTEIILAANDVAFIRRDGRVLVSPAPGQGVLFGFEE
jgi:hypothetical protein